MARFFIVTINYAPEPSGFAPHVTAFARHLAGHGHEVSVFTGFPWAPAWHRRAEDRGRLFATEHDGNLTIHRLTHFIPRRPSSAVQRILMEGSFSVVGFVALVAAMLERGRPDAFIYVGAQPALAMLVRMVAALVRRPYLYASPTWRHARPLTSASWAIASLASWTRSSSPHTRRPPALRCSATASSNLSPSMVTRRTGYG